MRSDLSVPTVCQTRVGEARVVEQQRFQSWQARQAAESRVIHDGVAETDFRDTTVLVGLQLGPKFLQRLHGCRIVRLGAFWALGGVEPALVPPLRLARSGLVSACGPMYGFFPAVFAHASGKQHTRDHVTRHTASIS